jgi:hypothetical protein
MIKFIDDSRFDSSSSSATSCNLCHVKYVQTTCASLLLRCHRSSLLRCETCHTVCVQCILLQVVHLLPQHISTLRCTTRYTCAMLHHMHLFFSHRSSLLRYRSRCLHTAGSASRSPAGIAAHQQQCGHHLQQQQQHSKSPISAAYMRQEKQSRALEGTFSACHRKRIMGPKHNERTFSARHSV